MVQDGWQKRVASMGVKEKPGSLTKIPANQLDKKALVTMLGVFQRSHLTCSVLPWKISGLVPADGR